MILITNDFCIRLIYLSFSFSLVKSIFSCIIFFIYCFLYLVHRTITNKYKHCCIIWKKIFCYLFIKYNDAYVHHIYDCYYIITYVSNSFHLYYLQYIKYITNVITTVIMIFFLCSFGGLNTVYGGLNTV